MFINWLVGTYPNIPGETSGEKMDHINAALGNDYYRICMYMQRGVKTQPTFGLIRSFFGNVQLLMPGVMISPEMEYDFSIIFKLAFSRTKGMNSLFPNREIAKF